jgi:hypothetical protein
MKISFNSTNKKHGYPFRIIGNAGRYDTISDCAFIDASHIVCADRQMACLYLLEYNIENNTHKIKHMIECKFDDGPFHFELITMGHDPISSKTTLYGVSYNNKIFSCNIVNYKFVNCELTQALLNESYHGIQLLEDGLSVYATNMKKPSIAKFNIKTSKSESFLCAGGVRMKDVAIIDETHIIALSSDKGPVNGEQLENGTVHPRCKPYNSHVLIYNRLNFALLCKHTLEDTQIDSCVYHAPFCYVTCTDSNGNGFILRGLIDNVTKQIVEIKHMPCKGFPHGIDIAHGCIAYTSYTESALYIYRLPQSNEFPNLLD